MENKVSIDGIWYELNEETKTVAVIGYSYGEIGKELVIPTIVTSGSEKYNVTRIGDGEDYHFPDRNRFCYYGVTSITIPESVTSIGNDAFKDCTSLTTIIIPKSVTNIGNRVFWGCSNLTSIVVAKENTKYDSRNGCNAIIETSTNTLVCGCKATIIPESVTSIGDGAFGKSSLTTITIPKNVTNIGIGIFVNCSNLTSIVVAKSNTKYDSRNNCNAIIETSTNTLVCGCATTIISKGITNIGDFAFWGCSPTTITIPKSVTNIGNRAFGGAVTLLVLLSLRKILNMTLEMVVMQL